MKTTRNALNEAFAEVESLDYGILSLVVNEEMEISGEVLWEGFPPVLVNPGIAEWNNIGMVMTGHRSTGAIAVEFEHNADGSWKCLMSEEERMRIHEISFGKPTKAFREAVAGMVQG